MNDTTLAVLYDYETNLDELTFPILNKYHNETNKEEHLFNLKHVTVHLVKEISLSKQIFYHFYISCIIKNIKKDIIESDFKKINSLLKLKD